MTAVTHRLAALCFADIAGYTELSATNESEAIALVGVFQGVARRQSRNRETFMLEACAQLGRIDEAFALVDKLLIERKAAADQIPLNPLLDPLRSDPRWETMLERLGRR